MKTFHINIEKLSHNGLPLDTDTWIEMNFFKYTVVVNKTNFSIGQSFKVGFVSFWYEHNIWLRSRILYEVVSYKLLQKLHIVFTR